MGKKLLDTDPKEKKKRLENLNLPQPQMDQYCYSV